MPDFSEIFVYAISQHASSFWETCAQQLDENSWIVAVLKKIIYLKSKKAGFLQ
jgi:hypothetical protein